MRKKRGLLKGHIAHARRCGKGDAGDVFEVCVVLAERKRHKRGTRRHHGQAKAARDVVCHTRRAHLRDGRPARRNDQLGGRGAGNLEPAIRMPDVADRCRQANFDTATIAFIKQHSDDLPRRAVAKKLAERLFMPGDFVAFHQRQKVPLSVTTERGFCEMRVFR